jgi:hypothetical protein
MLANLLRRLSRWTRRSDAPAIDAPVPIVVSASGIEMAGVVYTSASDFVAALRRLNPKKIQFKPVHGTNYNVLEDVMRAIQHSGVHAKMGTVNVRFDECEKPSDHDGVS